MKQYEKYKDSGVEWLGEIPEHWTFERMKHIGQVTFSSVDRHELVTEKSVKVCHYPVAYKNESVDNNTTFPQGTCTDSEYANFQLLKGDIILTKDSETANDIGVPCFVKETIENCVCGYHLAQLRVNEANKINEAYLFRYIQSKNVSSHFETSCNGVTRFGLGKPIIENLLLLKPTIQEQQIIAHYLDHTISTIDILIKEKSALITKLQEKRKALINEVVTKGLNQNAPMRDSGIEWLGMIPEHWEVKRVGLNASIVRGGSPRPAGDPRFFNGNYMPWITVKEVTGAIGKYITQTESYLTVEGSLNSRIIEPETLLMSNSGATLGVPKISKIRGCINDGSVAFTSFSDCLVRDYLMLFFETHTDIYRDEMKGNGQPNLNTEIIKNTPMPTPPIHEQLEIITRAEIIKIRIDNIISEIQLQLQKLKEYKTAVISEVVTGKVDVREWKANQPPTRSAELTSKPKGE